MTRSPRHLEPREIDAYWRDGHVTLDGVFDPDEVRAWREECDRLWASVPVDRSNPRVQWRGLVGGGEVADRIDPVLDISPLFAALSRDPRLAGPAGQLLDGTAVPFRSKVITKRPGTLGYSLHQDYPYWEHLGLPPDAYVNALVALDPFDAASGSPELFSGLHHGRVPPPAENALDADESLVEGRPGVILQLGPGDVVFFHGLTPHRSGPNGADHPRRGLFLTYVPSRYPELEGRYVRERIDLRR
jgi:ectoine hydroxylase-related dioxygenase (phytanoyl-CoA dioxygenase family)